MTNKQIPAQAFLEFSKTWQEIIKEQKERIQYLETENNNLMSFIKDQTKLMVDYAYCYQGTAKDFIADVNYTKLKESINRLKTFDEDLVFKIQQIYSGVENDT